MSKTFVRSADLRPGKAAAHAFLILLLTAAAWSVARAAVDERGDLQRINERLDEPVRLRIDIRDLPFPRALEQIERAAGLSITVDPETLELLPYGPRTVVDIRMQGITLRSGLQRLCSNLGLTFTVRSGGIHVHAGPALERLGRRITPEEAGVLQELVRRPAREVLGARRVPVAFSGFSPNDEPERIVADYLRTAGEQTGYDALESLAAGGRLTWRLDGPRVLLMTRMADLRERLTRRISLNLQDRPIDLALVEVGQKIGARLSFDAGVQQRLIAEALRVTDLILRNAEAGQALELLCSRAGLSYRISDAGIFIEAGPAPRSDSPASTHPGSPPTISPLAPAPATGRDADGGSQAQRPATLAEEQHFPGPPSRVEPLPIPRRVFAVLRIPVGSDGTTIDFLLYEDELPPEFLALKRSRLPLVVEHLRHELGVPATQGDEPAPVRRDSERP